MKGSKVLEGYRVTLGDWEACSADASAIRHEVFVVEQKVPVQDEQDEHDAVCVHAVAYAANGEPVGTGRLLPDGHIGRMAVRRSQRGKGLGSLLLTRLMEEARRRGLPQVVLAAQVSARPFYAAHGFEAHGSVFLDAGIEHIMMRRAL
ncbi:GNAT family N-acetyltransferase [Achromobacter sp. F4_2707]|uniref:GNAT family N-acetyltransferase n=1 Tax=Achromobacter sp. F4_2707 TaxID=3114286 RepID=UPI0039C743D1